ncbi:MAG: hypothetical protein ABFR35_07975, partial [Thermodesulfobacteriota bacterium]
VLIMMPKLTKKNGNSMISVYLFILLNRFVNRKGMVKRSYALKAKDVPANSMSIYLIFELPKLWIRMEWLLKVKWLKTLCQRKKKEIIKIVVLKTIK